MKLDMTSHDCTKLYRYLIVPVVGHGRPIYGTRLSHYWDAATHHGVFVRRLLASLALLLALGATSAQTDYSGTYLIKSASVNKKTAGDYYICPTEGWIYYEATNTFTETDNGQPFLTTYQCKTGGYDVRKALWKIEKSGDYYTIKHVIDGKYMVYNGKISNANAGRIRIHLADVETPGDNELFLIGTNRNGKIVISPKNESTIYFNVCQGNINSLAGSTEWNSKSKNDGPTTPTNHKNDIHGTIGLYNNPSEKDDKVDPNAPFELEAADVCETPTITYNESNGEVSISTTTDGATIYYTTDGTEPTTSSSSYSVPFTVSNTTTIQAIAVKAGMYNSMTASKHVVKYTYIIVNRAGEIATQHTIPYPVSAGTPLSGYASIPEEIKSPYISDEEITFKSFEGPFSAAALNAADEIHETPATENIYITYTVDKLGGKLLHLQGASQFNLKNGSGEYFVNSSGTTLTFDEVNTETTPNVQNKNKDHIWYISGGDPYAVTITSAATSNYLTSTPSVSGTANTFILKSESGSTVTFQDASGSVAVTINEVTIPTSYYLIDKAGRRILGPVISTSSSLAIPSDWKSPLAEYHYWKSSSFNESGDVYTLKDAQTELTGLDDLGEGEHIYITYDVKDDIDIEGGMTYLMKFEDGQNFLPEDGNNGVAPIGSEIKAVYPYNNGDFNLYIYGAAEWTKQLSSGASTRTRWLWYLVSNHEGTDLTDDAVDPYHVIVKSRQNQSYKVGDNSYAGNAYFYTFKHGGNVVTGVITQHDVVKTFSPELAPTEYMLLGEDVNHLVLKTVNQIDGDHQTVNKFEQYWKNYPTVETEAGEVNPSAVAGRDWHRYQDWAYAEPWGGGTKTYEKGNHWFQTVSMGTGKFSVEAVVLEPEVILLDQHGWEIARIPMSQKATLKKYDSPMVQQYHWYPSSSASKVSGYHKYTVSSQEITVYDSDGNAKTVEPLTYIHNSNSLADIPYDHAPINDQIAKVKTDFYVTYTVKSDYAGAYQGAATEGSVKASSYFLKQAGKYAQNSSNTIALVDQPSLTGVIPTDVQWKVKPNFNIDHEMGYKYSGETGALPGAESKIDIETAYNEAGKNGFDPYNVQIQSVSNTARYFTADTKSSTIERGIWKGTGSTKVSLREMSVGHTTATGYDQTTLDITNATFMIVDDGNGNMRLMPRFDNTKVMTSFSGLSEQLPAAAVGNNGEGTQSLVLELVPIIVSSTDEILSMRGYYVLTENFDLKASIGSSTNPFEGTIDGQLYHQTFDIPLVLYAKDAIIRNIILDDIGNLSSGNTEHHLGAIACTAQGETRIYNCGVLAGSLTESGHVGGIVGHLQDYSHVANCYSYAEIKGGSVVGGVVGYNNYASTSDDLRTMVMNCMFYGDITGGSNASPVYGGYKITNLSSENGLNTFNYYAYEKLKSTTIADNKYNCALAVKDEYLNRFEFYRLLLNSNKKLAAYYASTSTTTVQPSDMAKWVLETADRDIATPKPYPVLKAQGRYPSIINYDVENAPTISLVNGRPTEEDRNKGGNLGTLSVTISGTGTNAPSGASITTVGSLELTRTDKDPAHFNFNYDKVQLPYYNDVGVGNYTENRVVTGWKIISMSPVPASDPYSSSNYPASGVKDYPDFNFADRKSVNKDLNSVSGRIFSQGAYFDVPYGVTSITIEPYWGKAAYVADEKLDVTYKSDYKSKTNLLGTQATNNSTEYPGLNGQKVYTKIGDALGTLDGATVYDNALVLVGNLHLDNVPSGGDKAFTMMSVDWDSDNEPDYSMIYHHTGRTVIAPIRFDFLNIPGTAQAQKPNGTKTFLNFTIFKTKGWFETTNTCLVYSNQVEYENKDNVGTKQDAPLILLGGDFEQFVSTQSNTVDGHTTYIHVGSNVRIQSFGLGTHGDGSQSTPHIPVSVTGGEYKEFYLSGTYNQDAKVRAGDNAECYISGGYFEEAAGASQEKIDGSVTWQIYEADMDAFYGGGVNAAKPITGDVTVNIFNSHVTLYCGGPKFGDMQSGKNVTTNAEGCTFTKYFGAGFGGTSYSRKKYYDVSGAGSWSSWASNFTNAKDRGKYFDGKTTNSKNGGGDDAQYGKKGIGVATDVDYEFFAWSGGTTGGRFYIKFASFSLAACNDVESNLKDCIINENFYGGGSYGEVKGKATSVLDGCTVHGNVFGGGFSATLPKVKVRKTPAFSKNPKINNYSGMFEPGVLADFEESEFEWKKASDYGVTLTNGNSGSDLVNHYLYTDVDLTALGKVGSTDLTIKGSTLVEGKIFNSDGSVKETTGGVFGGGDMSAVNHDTQVNIVATGTNGVLNVFGGGNVANVGGSTVVNMNSGIVSQRLFGGGNMADVTTNSNVNIIGGSVLQGVYGGCNAQGAIGGNTEVTLTGGIIGTAWDATAPAPLPDRVFGGGLGEPTLVNGNVTVKVGTKSADPTPVYAGEATVWGNVYGGSAFGNTNASRPAEDLVIDATKKTNVYLYSGTIHGEAYGGGLGQKNGVNGATSDVVSLVGGDVYVLLDGAKVQQVFGANNLNGTPKGHVKVHVKRTNNFDDAKNALKLVDTTPLADRGKDGEGVRCYDVEAVYGGGNQADYVPTDALIVLDPNDPEYATKKEKFEKAFAEVLIEGCDSTSIEYVYGGGNAAAAPATEVTVNSAYIIDQLFGGGNGAGDGNPGADVGVIDKAAYEADNANGRYGTGIAKTKLIGGQVHVIYGGSNERGNVVGGTALERKESNEKCALKVGEIYGAGQVAPMDGDVNIELDCMPEEFVEAVYGGAKNATINGNVSLTVRSGKFGRVFGGNDQGGSINGSITVNAYEGGCEPLIIGELYGGGYNAPYSIWGCHYDDEDGTWTPNAREGEPHVAVDADAIRVNVFSCTSIGRVFGGGYGVTADVVGNTHVWINEQKGTVNDVEQDHIGKIAQVFGGGNAAPLTGNATIEIGTETSDPKNAPLGVNITSGTAATEENGYLNPTANSFIELEAGVYGGGYSADVVGNTTLIIGTASQSLGVNIAGNIFGGGYGQTTTVTGDVTVNIGNRENTAAEGDPVYTYEGYANITGDVYGGSAKGKVNATKGGTVESPTFTANAGKATEVNLYGGTITGNMYGGGLGEDNEGDYAADVYGPVTVNVEGGSVTNVFGCNNVLGSPQSTATVYINNTKEPEAPATYAIANVYGGGNQAAYNGTGGVSVVMKNGYVNDVYGGGLGTTATVNGATSVTLKGGTVKHDVYGGGSQGNVTEAVTVALNGGTVENDVYGGGALALTNTAYDGANETYRTYVTNVNLAGSTVTGSVYGGGLGQLATPAVLYTAEDAEVIASTKNVGDVKTPAVEAVAANVNGPVTVTVTGGKAANVFGCNNIYGAPQLTVAVAVNGTAEPVAPATYAIANVYGGGNQAAYTGNPTVAISGGFVNDVFGGGLGATAIVTGSPSVTVSGGTVANDVFGGGSQADVTGNVTVSITGGTVVNDVYGGGALANTNTANWNAGSDTWAEGMTSASNVTNVTLTGGTVGNVYGGGLGAHAVGTVGNPGYTAAIEPKVYGDITVAVNPDIDPDPDVTQYGTARFLRAIETHDYEGTYKDADNVEHTQITTGTVYTKGCVFGANNKEGTPKGNIQVTVWSTTPAEGATREYGIYEIQNVYGGGNLSAYEPAAGKTTRVDIHGCDRTSIQFVFGGGNAASVPETNVTIWGSYEIETVFGGGNGSEPFWDRAEEKWVVSPGAAVTTSNVYLKGGYIHSAFGGSYERGTVEHTNIDKSGTAGECVLRVTDVFGGGKDADVEGGINIIISDCTGGLDDLVDEGQSTEYIKNVYAGSYNARVFGPVVLTVTSGVFTNVFGGNHTSGFINGPITINIEETEDCKPVIIDNLYGGGNFAHYPGLGANYATPKITINVKAATRIGNIFGGCNHADVTGDTEININMIKGWWAGKTYDEETIPNTIGTIGNVYGGGNEGRVIGNTAVNIGTVTGIKVMKRDGDNQILATDGLVLYDNEGKVREGAVPDSTDVIPVLGAHIIGNVYGGCNFDDVTGNSTVNLCTANYSGVAGFAGVDIDNGSVYGGGNHGNVLGNTHVTMAGGYVFDGVYGGGMHGSVGTFTRDKTITTESNGFDHSNHKDACIGKPTTCTSGGTCTVLVSGGQVGPVEVAKADGGMKNTARYFKKTGERNGPVDYGFVFGAGRGEIEDPSADVDADFHCYVNSTNVTISGTALIMASVYGGGENGRVLGDTHVTIAGGQIGCGEKQIDGSGNPIRYAESAFINPLETLVTDGNALAECAHWNYTAPYMPHDPLYFEPLLGEDDDDSDAASMGSDGHTYYGNVFGGGSGYYPYEKIDKGEKKHDWLRSAGLVEGNTVVDITGGHILTNVYGGNETTDVLGKCTINMTGGTIGVPRTLSQIADHPVTCYLFGAGKGDQRTHFNTWTDVDAVEVNVSGGIVYGSVFGGGEDGHVVNNVKLTVEKGDSYTVGGKTFTDGPVIGTWGTSYVEGNVFGGGRGFSGEALTAGNVGGNISLNVSGGFILGSVYGGGRLASVGYSLVAPEDSRYGKLQDGDAHGNVAVTISGGVIGNDYEYSYIDPSVTGAALTAAKAYMPHTLHDADNRLTHTKGGNVFAGGMGRLYGLDGTTPLLSYDAWQKLGKVKSTTLTITGGTIKSNVYGGSEFGFVGDMSDVINNTTELTHITISGGTIGSEVKDDGDVTRYTFGSVYGGGYGSTVEKITPDDVDDSAYDDNDNPKFISGRVHGSTNISMTGGTVLASIYGGGEVANVRGSSTVTVSDGTVGKTKDEINNIYYGGATMGNVYGGGNGSRTIVRCGQVFGNALVTISGGTIYHNVYGGGAYGSVGDIKWIEEYDDTYKANKVKGVHEDGISTEGTGTATIVVTGGTIGVDGRENGMVFGSSRGDVIDKAPRDDYMAWVYDTHVTIGTAGYGTTLSNPLIKGSVYGGGENGHTFHDTDVRIHSGTIGDPDGYFDNRGNVYGAGCGTDTYTEDAVEKYKPEAGIVYGNTSIHIDGGQVSRNVYGAGALGTTKGSTTVTITGDAVIGDNLDNGTDDGNVFGAARGDIALNSPLNLAYVGSTTVTIAGGLVKNNVFGGGEAGVVKGSVVVNMNGGTVGKNLYGGGALSNTNTNNVTENYGADTGYTNPTETIPTTNTNTTAVNLLGGTIQGNAYGGGLGRRPLDAVGTPGDPGYKPAVEAIFAKVYGDVTVDLNNNNNGGTADGSKAGCAVTKVFGCNDMHGTPRGRVRVHVYATQHPNRTAHATMSSKYRKYENLDEYTITNYSDLTDLATTVGADVSAYKTILEGSADEDTKKQALTDMHEAISKKKYDVQAVYGGGDLACYEPVNAFSTDEAVRQSARVEVIIDGCALTSIHEVYGSGNASATPASSLTVYGCYEIDELFGGGNGKDPYQLGDGKWYANPGANVGYRNYTHYVKDGTHGDSPENPYTAVENTDATSKEHRIANYAYGSGEAHTDVFGGRIHSAYGGSNMVGNIRFLAMSSYDSSSDCPSNIDHTYAGGNEAEMDGKSELLAKCVGYMHKLYGGNTNADYNNDILMTITNGVFGTVIGGNDQGGKVSGSITINIKEGGCNPIIIDKLYGGGYEAGYSIYGYNKSDGSPRTKEDYDRDLAAAMDAIPVEDRGNETVKNNALIEAGLFGFPKASPRINIISATKIGEVYGGGYNSVVVGNPTINVNMEEGQVLKEYVDKHPEDFTVDTHTLTTSYHKGGIDVEREDDYAVVGSVAEGLAAGNAILKVGTIGTIFGGGDQADVIGNTTVEIGTGSWFNPNTHLTETVERKAAFVLGNVYGGGRMGNVGNFTKTAGKPTSCVDGTGVARVVINNGEIGPSNMKMYHTGVIPADDQPDNSGHVFGGGKGTNHIDDDDQAFCDSTEVIIGGTAWVKGSVFGGGENGHVLHNAGVKISGDSQIGEGHIKIDEGGVNIDRGLNRSYTAAEWAAGHLIPTAEDFSDADELAAVTARYANSLPECSSWDYGEDTNSDGKDDTWAPYDMYEGAGGYDAKGGKKIASSGRTFYGNVFGGGSGFYPYEAGKWLDTAGQVEGDTWVEISGGHVLTSIYGGCEMSSMLGDAHVKMTGGTLGVPRTLAEIDAHPVTCYLFGGGKGDQRVFFNRSTDVRDAHVTVEGGTVYGSVFGGGEDGHVMRHAYVTIGKDDGTGPKIGTWGTSYVEGNIFGAGRGFGGDAYTAGNVAGSVEMNIKGGSILGSVYGGGRLGSVGYGLYMENATGKYGTMRPDNTDTDEGSAYREDGVSNFRRGYVTLNITGGTIGNPHEFIVPQEGNIPTGVPTDFTTWTDSHWTTWQEHNHVPNTTYDHDTGRLLHAKGGNVYASGMGRYYKLDGTTPISTYASGELTSPIEWKKLGNVKSTSLTISGDTTWIMGSVYGGGEMGVVTPYTDSPTNPTIVQGGTATVTVTGGTIGTEVTGSTPVRATIPVPAVGNSNVRYTFGSVYGGGMGRDEHDATQNHGGGVHGSTSVSVSGADTKIRASVYGGGEMAVVDSNTTVTFSGGEIGRNEVKAANDADAGNVMFGGTYIGNVYGGGKGELNHVHTGLVRGNTTVNISGGAVCHNVYGGGALASVGTFKVSKDNVPDYIPLNGVPYDWTEGTGTATVNITGGTIGISGRDNGMVSGSSRGDLMEPEPDPLNDNKVLDLYDHMAWVNNSVVNIGLSESEFEEKAEEEPYSSYGSYETYKAAGAPKIRGSVYGGGENGHNSGDATVNVKAGTIGIVEKDNPWILFATDELNAKALVTRGNVYGAGCGTDTYTGTDGRPHHNPKAGMIGHNTTVNISGGIVANSVYGAGSMASVGTFEADSVKHSSELTGFALSWPYKITVQPGTGKATVNITGGHIGAQVALSDGRSFVGDGDVYGSARGYAGDRYATAHLAFAGETEVNVNYPATADIADVQDLSTPCVTGSVHGSGENGYVYGDTKVTLMKGLVGHSLYGAGKGNDTYTKPLNKIDGGGTYDASIYSLIAGRVMGNTEVTMHDGHVGRNVYGGGNLGSVGKGNYAGGDDDYFPTGYGEMPTGNLWTSASDGDDAWQFLHSGKTAVKVFGGTVGYIDPANPALTKNGLIYGNVFGGSAGEAAPNVPVDLAPRYEYVPAFFSGYVNETDVNIGGYRCKTAYGDYHVGDWMTAAQFASVAVGDTAKWEKPAGPAILGSVYGGGQDGHVRRDTKVTVAGGEIGLPFTDANRSLLQTSALGMSEELNSPLWLHRGNVYGGGSGITKAKYDYNYDGDLNDTVTIDGIKYVENDYSNSSGSVTRFTEVNILGGIVHRNVYGGGSIGSVGAPKITQDYDPYKPGQADIVGKPVNGPGRQSLNSVTIGGGKGVANIGTPTDYNKVYGGEVYGAGRGNTKLDAEQFGSSVWTLVRILNGANIKGNVYGGGDSGMVKKNSEVIVGEKGE